MLNSYPRKFELSLPELPLQKPLEARVSYLEIYKDHIVLKYDFLADEREDNDSLTWKENIRNYHIVVAGHENISGFELYLTDAELWKVVISINGMRQDIACFYEDLAPAKTLLKTLYQWKYNGTAKL